MILVEPGAQLFKVEDIYKKIELAGRVCYKSEDKITDTSYKKFIKMLIKSGHYSVLEHADITLHLDIAYLISLSIPQHLKNQFVFCGKMSNIAHANVRAWREYLEIYPIKQVIEMYPLLFGDIEGGLFSEDENTRKAEINEYSTNPYAMRESFIVTTSRDISHQLVRHRLLSISQESQRYCNYSKGKFGDVKFIMPEYIKNTDNNKVRINWINNRDEDEREYNALIKEGARPEDARNCLPNCTATTLVLTGSLWEWKHILELRLHSSAQKEVRIIAEKIQQTLTELYAETCFEDYFL